MRQVFTPAIAGAIILMLFMLMVHLAGFGNNRPLELIQPSTPPAFDLKEISFDDAPTLTPEQIDPVELPSEPELTSEPVVELDFLPPEPITEPEIAEIEPAPLELNVEIEPLELVLDDVAIAVKKPTPVVAKKKPKQETKPVEPVKKETAPKKTTSESPSKAKPAAAAPSRSQSRTSQPLLKVKPTYPKRARRRGIEGSVTVSFVVNDAGKVSASSIKIIRAVPAKVFNKAVTKAVAKWKFRPGGGVRQETQKLSFTLK